MQVFGQLLEALKSEATDRLVAAEPADSAGPRGEARAYTKLYNMIFNFKVINGENNG